MEHEADLVDVAESLSPILTDAEIHDVIASIDDVTTASILAACAANGITVIRACELCGHVLAM